MALVPCPHCGRDISAASPACRHCGRPRSLSTRVAALAVDPPALGTFPPDDVLIESAVAEEHDYFPVSPTKFVVMSLCTFGLYKLYWCYQNWARMQERTREHISPFWRAWFAPFWGFVLFGKMRSDLAKSGLPIAWNASVLGGLYLILALCARLPSGLWIASLCAFVAFIPVVQTVRDVNSLSKAREGLNESFSTANIVTIVVGGLLLALAVFGTFIGDPDQSG